jgi:uncharacterized phage protein (TIGR01671 family)
MREIKFRAWDSYYQKMIYDIVGQNVYGEAIEPDGTGYYHSLRKLAVMQYTGLKDKNGREIYEGDVVLDVDSECIGQVVFATPEFSIEFPDKELWPFVHDSHQDIHIKVIGNIYENPELVKK